MKVHEEYGAAPPDGGPFSPPSVDGIRAYGIQLRTECEKLGKSAQ
jgi:hypothetical protein